MTASIYPLATQDSILTVVIDILTTLPYTNNLEFYIVMPVTKTAKRALRGSKNKESVNSLIMTKLEIAIRGARKNKTSQKIISAISLTDRAAKKKVIHKNKAARIKAQLAKLLVKKSESQSSKKNKKTTSRKVAK